MNKKAFLASGFSLFSALMIVPYGAAFATEAGLDAALQELTPAQQEAPVQPPEAVSVAVTPAPVEEPLVKAQPEPVSETGMPLRTALGEAYNKNPVLLAERARLKAVEENYSQAKSGFLPWVNGQADYTSSHTEYSNLTQSGDPKTLSVGLNQSIYSGGSTRANMREAESQIKAAQAQLHQTEQRVLLEAVLAYMNLVRDQEIVRLNRNNEKVLEEYLKASEERFELGDITKTDVSQSESRLAAASADRIAAEGNLRKSRAFFERVIGIAPPVLERPEDKIVLPSSAQEAVTLAEHHNPSIAIAQHTQAAAKNTTRAIEGTRLPQVDLIAGVSRIYDPVASFGVNGDADVRSIGVRATMPFYTGGNTVSRIRQSKQNENRLRMETFNVEREVREATIAAWETLAAAEAESQARLTQISAAKLALDGVKVEAEFGSRTTLDVLDAEQEYLDAQVAQTVADTEKTIASYGVLAAVGRLTAGHLGLDIEKAGE